MRNEINFIRNWNNKLTGGSFTSIRPKDVNRWHEGETYAILLNRHHIATAELVSANHLFLKDITEQDARIDSGYGVHEFIPMFKRLYAKENIDFEKRMVSVLTFTKIKQHQVDKKSTEPAMAAGEAIETYIGSQVDEYDGFEISDEQFQKLKDQIY